ncbi:MAG: hypothetical protein MI861_27255, partial [Pirellulales bacterium]|nr:hypothetical protein [Pirellulales bacterium]
MNLMAKLGILSGESKPARLVIHVGAHKTGSTFIQSVLRDSRRQLKRCNTAYVRRWGYELGKFLKNSSQELPRSEIQRLQQELAQELSQVRQANVIMSGESLFGDPFRCYDNNELAAEMLRRITADWEVHVVALIRQQDT